MNAHTPETASLPYPRRPAFAWIVALGLATLWPTVAAACSCIAPPNATCARIGDRSRVFLGKVVHSQLRWNGLVSTFEVEEAFHGPVSSIAQVTTAPDGGACGVTFRRGERWVVWAHQTPRGFVTSLCSGNEPVSQASRTLDYFRNRPGPDQVSVDGRVLQGGQPGGRQDGAADVEVLLRSGNEERRVSTDGRGYFFSDQFPAGDLEVTVVEAEGQPPYRPHRERVEPGACVQIELRPEEPADSE